MAVTRRFGDRIVEQTAQGLAQAMDSSAKTSAVKATANTDGFRFDLRVTPVLDVENLDEEKEEDRSDAAQQRQADRRAPEPEKAALELPVKADPQTATDDSGIDLTGENDVTHNAIALDESNEDDGEYESSFEENSEDSGEEDGEEEEAPLAPLILQDYCTDTRESPFQVREGIITRYPKLHAPNRSLVLRPVPGALTSRSRPPAAQDVHVELRKLVGRGLTAVKSMKLPVFDDKCV